MANRTVKKILGAFFGFIQRYLFSFKSSQRHRAHRSSLRSLWLRPLFKSADGVTFNKVNMLIGPKHISIGEGTVFDDFLYLAAWDSYNGGMQRMNPELSIGSGCSFGAFNSISCCNRISIGDNLLTGKNVTISDNNHGATDIETLRCKPSRRPIVSKGPIVIGKNVWIGDKATILSGVNIGDGAVIAANCVVTKDIPAYSVAAGNPARIVRQN